MANKSKQRIARRRTASKRKSKLTMLAVGMAALGISAYVFFLNAPQALPTDLSNVQVGTEVGSFAPDFTLSDINGASVSLSDLRGRPVAIMFFHTW